MPADLHTNRTVRQSSRWLPQLHPLLTKIVSTLPLFLAKAGDSISQRKLVPLLEQFRIENSLKKLSTYPLSKS